MSALYDNLRFPSGPRFVSPTGKRFDRLFVLAFAGNRKGHSYWKSVCDCGEMVVMSQKDLKRKSTRSCGCAKVNYLGTAKGDKGGPKKISRALYDTIKMPSHARFKNLLGKRFEKLFVLAFDGKRGDSSYWKCVCDCGSMRVVRTTDLGSGRVRSCGCGKDKRPQRGRELDPEYMVWSNMRRRCGEPSNQDYRNYGGKGITVCERWAKYENFIEDMGRRPTPDYSIDRIDGNGNYELSNCRWATATEQARNISTNVLIEHDGKRMCIAEWAEELGMNQHTLGARIRSGWSAKEAIETPVGEKRPKEVNE